MRDSTGKGRNIQAKKNNPYKCQEIRVYMAHLRRLGGAGIVHEDVNDQVLGTVLNGYDRYNLLDIKIICYYRSWAFGIRPEFFNIMVVKYCYCFTNNLIGLQVI